VESNSLIYLAHDSTQMPLFDIDRDQIRRLAIDREDHRNLTRARQGARNQQIDLVQAWELSLRPGE